MSSLPKKCRRMPASGSDEAGLETKTLFPEQGLIIFDATEKGRRAASPVHCEAAFCSAFREEILNDSGDAFDLSVGHFRIDGKAEALAGGFFGDGEIAGFVAEMSVSFLKV